jgi:hypothetical protein
MNFRTIGLIGIVVVVLIIAARLYLSGHRVPADQPPLGDLDAGTLEDLKSDFNRNADKFRIILLLSPT